MDTPRGIEQKDLRDRMGAGTDLILLDVRLKEDFDEQHIPGATNACVFEVAFLENVTAAVSDPGATIVVYGTSEKSHASRVAAEKLCRQGYANVYDYRGGVAEWFHRPAARPSPRAANGEYTVDPGRSRVLWTGRNLGGQHDGAIAIDTGALCVCDGLVAHAAIVLDMDRITCADIADPAINRVLIDHLRSDDFFDTAMFPAAKVVISRAQALPDSSRGLPNTLVTAELTLKGVTEGLEFPAIVGTNADGDLVLNAHFDFDRTRWNVTYGSGRLFENLGMHLVNDHISIQVVLVASPDRRSASP